MQIGRITPRFAAAGTAMADGFVAVVAFSHSYAI
jgi:hypothetical protein